MTNKNTSDLHCHLNGSFSLQFLKKTALKNNCLEIYEEFVSINSAYLNNTAAAPEAGFPKEMIDLIWKQFSLIHKMIQNLNDISEGVLDVVQNSSAKYLEIRTTPKAMANWSRENYIDAFRSLYLLN